MFGIARAALMGMNTRGFLPSLEVSWFFGWLYLSALGGRGGCVSFSSRPSKLLLDYRQESRVLKASRTGGETADEIERTSVCGGAALPQIYLPQN